MALRRKDQTPQTVGIDLIELLARSAAHRTSAVYYNRGPINQAVQAILLWSDLAFTERSALARTGAGTTVLRPDIAGVIRAAYDPVMPAVARDASHALRLSARLAPPS